MELVLLISAYELHWCKVERCCFDCKLYTNVECDGKV